MEDIRLILQERMPILRERYSVQRIGVFGSYARRQETASSDMDLLVELAQPVGWEMVDLPHTRHDG